MVPAQSIRRIPARVRSATASLVRREGMIEYSAAQARCSVATTTRCTCTRRRATRRSRSPSHRRRLDPDHRDRCSPARARGERLSRARAAADTMPICAISAVPVCPPRAAPRGRRSRTHRSQRHYTNVCTARCKFALHTRRRPWRLRLSKEVSPRSSARPIRFAASRSRCKAAHPTSPRVVRGSVPWTKANFRCVCMRCRRRDPPPRALETTVTEVLFGRTAGMDRCPASGAELCTTARIASRRSEHADECSTHASCPESWACNACTMVFVSKRRDHVLSTGSPSRTQSDSSHATTAAASHVLTWPFMPTHALKLRDTLALSLLRMQRRAAVPHNFRTSVPGPTLVRDR